MPSDSAIQNGKLLIAEPFMSDPNFRRTVVLLCDHHKDGTLGLILNRRLDMQANQLLASLPQIEAPLHFGGPVQKDTIFILHNLGDIIDGSERIANGIYWGGKPDVIAFLIDAQVIQPHNIRFYVGYTGWGQGQLHEEMSNKSWIATDADPNYVFRENERDLWEFALDNMGQHYSVISQMNTHYTLMN